MENFKAHAFSGIFRELRKLIASQPSNSYEFDEGIGRLREVTAQLLGICQEFDLPLSFKQTARMAEGDWWDNWYGLSNAVANLETVIEDELSLRIFLAIQPEKERFYKADSLFSAEAEASFPSTVFDIQEAGKCFALNRHTACVYHTMRILEAGLRVLADDLGAFDPKDPSWGNILSRCNGAIKKLPDKTDRGPDWKEDRRFYSKAAVSFTRFKDAWRNYVSHEREKYTEEQAEDIFASVRSFMNHLSERLSEPGV